MSARPPFGGLDVATAVARIEARDPALRALVTRVTRPVVDPLAPPDAPLRGVPYVLKDTWDTDGLRTTGGSYRHRERIPSAASTVYDALRRSGAVLLGKSNLGDMAFSPESDNHVVGAARHPLDPARTPGGSTGGGAAAVADGMAAFDWGTDFAGSIREPAAFCGVVGLRLSAVTWPVERQHFPRIPSLFWPLCGMGPLARTVDDARRVVDALAPALRASTRHFSWSGRVQLWGPDARTRGAWGAFSADVGAALRELGLDAETARLPAPTRVDSLFNGYLGSHFDDFIGGEELPFREGLAAVLLGLATRGRVDRRVHPNTGILLLGLALTRLTVHRSRTPWLRALGELRDATGRIWDAGDLLVLPTATLPAPRHGRTTFSREVQAFTKLGNLVDATAVSVPFGRFPDGFPRGLQIAGPAGSEDAVLDLAERIEALGHAASASAA